MSKDELKKIRIENLKKWFENRTLPVKDKSLISQLTSGKASFGERVSRRLEDEYGMGYKYLDTPLSQQITQSVIQSNLGKVGNFILWDKDNPLPNDEYAMLPFYKDISLSAGAGTENQEDHNGYKLAFSRATLRRYGINPQYASCVTVEGESMEPVLPDGATVGINMADKNIRDGKMYAIRQGEWLRVKRLYRLPNNQVRINSYNQDAPAFADEITPLEEIEIIGAVFWWSVMI